MLAQGSQWSLDAHGSHDAPAGSGFIDGKRSAKDSSADGVPAKPKGERVGRQQGGEKEGTHDGTYAANKAGELSFCVQITLGHAW